MLGMEWEVLLDINFFNKTLLIKRIMKYLCLSLEIKSWWTHKNILDMISAVDYLCNIKLRT